MRCLWFLETFNKFQTVNDNYLLLSDFNSSKSSTAIHEILFTSVKADIETGLQSEIITTQMLVTNLATGQTNFDIITLEANLRFSCRS